MIPKVGRGSSTGGLLRYVFGRGRANEHVDPHVVAASTPEWVRGGDLADLLDTAAGRRRLARDLDVAMLARDAQVAGGHVYHVVLALHPSDGAPGDKVWRDVVGDAVRAMRLDRCRWAAIEHGASATGAAHVHLVVNLVQDDGTVASVWRDRYRWREWARRVERERGWMPTGPSGAGQRAPAVREVRRARAAGRPVRARGRISTDQNVHLLELAVHRCAVLARSEQEFVGLLAEYRLDAAPHVSGGRVRGWRVREPVSGDWIAGGRLRRDLALPRLRARWPGPSCPPSTWWHPPAASDRAGSAPAVVQRLLRDAEQDLLQVLADGDPVAWYAAARQMSDLLLAVPAAGVPGAVAKHVIAARAELALAAEPPHLARAARARPIVVPVLADAARAVAVTGSLTPLVAAAVVLLVVALVQRLVIRAERHQVHQAALHRSRRALAHLAYADSAARAVGPSAAAEQAPTRGTPSRRRVAAPVPPQPLQQPRRQGPVR